jgi:acyl-CoA thioesterase-2
VTLLDDLAIERASEDSFRKRFRGWEGRSFGGTTLALAALAAGRTCEGRALHSLHAYFLRPVPPEVPVELVVERQSDGRRFAQRRVQVRRVGRLLC